MGILSKKEKEVKRPMQEVGRENSVTWYQDTNEIYVKSIVLSHFVDSYNEYGLYFPMREHVILGDDMTGDITLGKLIKTIHLRNYPNLFEYLLVYLQLPEPVEELFIAKYKEFKRQIALIQDKINQKRKKLL